MKKLISFAMICVICLCFSANIAATSDQTSTIVIGNIEFIFDNDSSFTAEQQLNIAEKMLNASESQTYGLMCTLFGHKYTTEYVTTITHNASPTTPKCLSETWELYVCSRCDHTEGTVIDSYYINCCE